MRRRSPAGVALSGLCAPAALGSRRPHAQDDRSEAHRPVLPVPGRARARAPRIPVVAARPRLGRCWRRSAPARSTRRWPSAEPRPLHRAAAGHSGASSAPSASASDSSWPGPSRRPSLSQRGAAILPLKRLSPGDLGDIVLRGGAWYFEHVGALVTNRQAGTSTMRDVVVGLRVCAPFAPP